MGKVRMGLRARGGRQAGHGGPEEWERASERHTIVMKTTKIAGVPAKVRRLHPMWPVL